MVSSLRALGLRVAVLSALLGTGCSSDEGVAGPSGIGGTGALDSGGSDSAVSADATGACTPGEQRVCYSGPASTQNIGACKDGIETCDGSGFGPCVGEVTPAVEACDGLDNDCNGAVDEGCSCFDGESRTCYGGPASTLGKGSCQAGTQSCTGGAWSACIGEVLPVKELCNDLDDDCDGLVDEDWAQEKICLKNTYNCPNGYYRSKILACDPACGECLFCVNGYFCDRACAATVYSCCVTGDCPQACPSGYKYTTTVQRAECGCGIAGDTAVCEKQ